MAEAKTKHGAAGCLIGIMKLFTTDAMWFWLMHAVLTRVDASTLEWYVFWTYVPASVLFVLGISLFGLMTEES